MRKNYIIYLSAFMILYSCAKQSVPPDEKLKMEFITIDENLVFEMGNPFDNNRASDTPIHTVNLSPFRIGKYEVSTQQYCQFLNEAFKAGKIDYSEHRYQFKGSYVRAAGSTVGDTLYYQVGTYRWNYYVDFLEDSVFHIREGCGKYPAIMVTQPGAKAFARFYGWRLPTEAEWERVARGPNPGRKYPWGNEMPNCNLAVYGADFDGGPECYEKPQEVTNSTTGISAEGCYNMAGNVWEMCADFYDENYYQYSPEQNPKGPSGGDWLSMRGGSVYDKASVLGSSRRARIYITERHSNVGFRVAKNVE